MSIKEYIQKLVGFSDLSREEASSAIREIMSGDCTAAQIGSFLTALRMKGEGTQEILGMVEVMRELCVKVDLRLNKRVIDIVGTGGDSLKTFNVSTVSALIVAGAGGYVAKHGNRSVTSKCGSADLLERFGVKLEVGPEKVKECVERVGIGFMFAPIFHPAMKKVASPRREIGIRTVFNILGPLTNPAMVRAELLGVYDANLLRKIANVLAALGHEESMVVHGLDGLDEISVSGKTLVAWLREGEVKEMELTPTQLGINLARPEEIKTSSMEENVEVAYRIISGEISKNNPQRALAVVNAAAAMIIADVADGFSDAIEKAQESIESGAALKKLEELVRISGGDEELLEQLKSRYA